MGCERMTGAEEAVLEDDRPRSMREQAVRNRRRSMLHEPHVAPLTAYTEALRNQGIGEVPDFDPFDGGTDARVLFLFEKPGPKTSEAAGGSGFISRNNDDPTAEATFQFMREAKIPRKLTATWNVIPSWNATRAITSDELRHGAARVEELVGLLPNLRAVVFVGKKAHKAKPYLEGKAVQLFSSSHPSPLVRASHPDRWRLIPTEWVQVHPYIA